MAKRVKAQFDAEAMLHQAMGFVDAAKILYSMFCERTPHLAFPMMVNVAFASELGLKVLRHIEAGDQPLETHNLWRLFQDLSSESQDWIADEWERHSGLDKLREDPAHDGRVPNSLLEALKQAENAFLHWRYPPKGSTISIHLGPFPAIVVNRVLLVKPEWAEIKFRLQPIGQDR